MKTERLAVAVETAYLSSLLPQLLYILFQNPRVVLDDHFRDSTCSKQTLFGVHAGCSQSSYNRGNGQSLECTKLSITRSAFGWVLKGSSLNEQNIALKAVLHRILLIVRRREIFEAGIPNKATILCGTQLSLPLAWVLNVVGLEQVHDDIIC